MPAKHKVKKAKKKGRPPKYDPERYPVVAKAMARLGATLKEVAEALGVAVSAVSEWKKRHPAFLEALKQGKALSDSHVEDGLYQRALGYEYVETKVVEDRTGVRTETTTKQRAPDVTAQIFWLKNRKPKEWRDVQYRELTGKDGDAIEISLADLERKLIPRPRS